MSFDHLSARNVAEPLFIYIYICVCVCVRARAYFSQNEYRTKKSDASDLSEPRLYVSGSKWDEKHLQALRVLVFDDLSTSRLFPERWLPRDNFKGKFYVPRILLRRNQLTAL